MSLQSYVDSEIKKVCPIIGVSFGDLSDKATWVIQYEESATTEQMNAAQAFISAFVWDLATQEIDRKNQRDTRYIDAPIYKSGYKTYLVSNPGATFRAYMDWLEE